MGKYLLALTLGFWVSLSLIDPVSASSTQAYQDYLFQFDTYRTTYNEFKIAKGEWEKYQTLLSQTTALDKTKTMLQRRDFLLRSYLMLLNEKINENPGLTGSDRQLYQGIISQEIIFLDNHNQLVPAVASLTDAETLSKQLESHYPLLQVSQRQIIVALALGQLSAFATNFDNAARQALELVNANRTLLSSDKQSTVDRWMLSISNKRRLYQQKYDAISAANAQLKGTSSNELDRTFLKLQKDLAEAKQYLFEGASFMDELTNVIRYQQ